MSDTPARDDAQSSPAAARSDDPIAPAPDSTAAVRTAGFGFWSAAVGLLIVAALIRAAIIADPTLGHESDMSFFIDWSRALAERGLAGFYSTVDFCDYPPAMLTLLWGVGHAVAALADLASDDHLWIALKCPTALADLLIGLMLLAEGRRRLGRSAGLAAAALYLLNPVTLYNSAYWGQVDAIYTALIVAALLCVGRRWWIAAGVASAIALGAKFQTIAILPLIIFEVYRVGGWRALGWKLAGAVVAAGVVLTPFAIAGVTGEALRRSYVDVIGQYHELSRSAYNLWYLTPDHDATDTSPPNVLIRHVAAGRVEISDSASWLLGLSWRRISLALYAVAVAIVLAVYSLRPGPIARWGAAGLLGLAFFLFPTEMHERYAFPAVALLAIWAGASRWNERVYLLLCGGLLLNIASRLPIEPLARQLSALHLAVFGVILAMLLIGRRLAATGDDAPPITDDEQQQQQQPRRLIPLFRWLTLGGVLGVTTAGIFAAAALQSPPIAGSADTRYLSELPPVSWNQGWKTLKFDRAVAGSLIHLGDKLYLRGLGTHAPARIVYEVPPGASEFRALVGIDRAAGGLGSVIAAVELDGARVFASTRITAADRPLHVVVPVKGAKRMVLIAEPTSDGRKCDHVDWALARFVIPAAQATEAQP